MATNDKLTVHVPLEQIEMLHPAVDIELRGTLMPLPTKLLSKLGPISSMLRSP
ncbi:MAG: hypothetical protein U0269_17190 [Polyangiales bacterium]